ncbi:unnamed protein product [Cercopithifilaria johnstoni]|uniref:Uncharacterized protein n=1 Tax=Cercopithifilaria johnstoni TaxID=2874296 RepID=A0A8J2Q7Y5_9BILA|nr:unnamed protein product [Cercopithifilaria johnstoni]
MAECAPGDENIFTTSTTAHILKHHQPFDEDGMTECAPGDENIFTTSTAVHILKHRQLIYFIPLLSLDGGTISLAGIYLVFVKDVYGKVTAILLLAEMSTDQQAKGKEEC